MHVCRIRRAILVLVLALTTQLVVAQSPTIQYVYDELGRLIAVIDVNGNMATYTYDAVGNILSINTHASSQVSIITFQPASAPTGTTVTIFGTGFSATASQDTVTFNGTSAVVTSATTTQLVVTVPSGATTGAIAVTAPGGSATSASSFTVTAGSGAPTITGFTPTIGARGASITVTGTNFDTVIGNDRARLNATLTPVASATTTTLVMTPPSAPIGGRITVATPLGAATSASDYFSPPSPYTPTDVLVTDRTTIGSSKTVTIGTSAKIGLVLFDGVAGHRVSVNVTSVTMNSVDLSILRPDGSTLTTAWSNNGGTFIGAQTLSITGSYMFVVAPESTNTGSLTFTLYDVPPDVSGTIVPGGSPVTVTTTAPGQNALLTFNGTSGHRVSLNVSNVSINGMYITLRNPDGSTLVRTWCNNGGTFIEPQTLGTTATYSILVAPDTTNTGSVTLTLYDVPADVSGTITPGGSAVTVTTTVPGQKAQLTFSGTASQKISLLANQVSMNGTYLTIQNPDGSNLVRTWLNNGGAFIDTQTLSTTGTYTILVDPENTNTGSMTLTLYNVPADASGTVTIGGSSTTVTTTVPGQNALVTFSGTSGQQATVHFTNSSLSWTFIKLLNPDGSPLTSTYQFASSFDLSTQTLPATGTYTITINPDGATVGSITVSVSNP
jgi:YD repeat-containing protein